jgi:hypothetical protein
MTPSRDDAEFAGIDAYITEQLSLAAAALSEQIDTQAKLDTVLRAASRSGKPGGAADANRGR